MNRDDIIRMAHEAGFSDIIKKGVWITDGCWDEELERFAKLVAAAEREACALVCEKAGVDGYGTLAAASLIRRGEKWTDTSTSPCTT
jgi:hypothetical protein